MIIVEMYRPRPPDLVIMDAVVTMEGYWPSSPEMRNVSKILASDDGVALDTAQAKSSGFDVEEIPCLRLAKEPDLGETDLGSIDIVGAAETIQEYHRPEPPELTHRHRAGIGTGGTSIDFYRSLVSLRPRILADLCSEGCSACAARRLDEHRSVSRLNVASTVSRHVEAPGRRTPCSVFSEKAGV